jgi:hypothetical protein
MGHLSQVGALCTIHTVLIGTVHYALYTLYSYPPPRGAGYIFGADISEQFLRKNEVSV